MIESSLLIFSLKFKNIYRMFIKNWKMFEGEKNDKLQEEIRTILHILNDEGYHASIGNLWGGMLQIYIQFPPNEIERSSSCSVQRFSDKFKHTEEMGEFMDRLDMCDESQAKLKCYDNDQSSIICEIDTGERNKFTYTLLPNSCR